ncbi:catalytic activity: A.nidulans panB converts 5 [Meredithblackwellia eburnea MCA 4105]
MSTGSVAKTVKRILSAAQPQSTFPLASTSRIIISPPILTTRFSPCNCNLRTYSTQPVQHKQGAAPTRKKRTINDLHSLKRKKVPITVLTAHDYPSARFIEQSALPPPTEVQASSSSSSSSSTSSSSTPSPHPRGVDICLVGDSLAMVACGYTSTTSLTLQEMLFHCRAVARGCTTSLLVADMPFGTFLPSVTHGIEAATKIIQEGNMDAVKIEGGLEVAQLVSQLTSLGIPVMGHVGLTPQRQAALSGYRVQGKTSDGAFHVLQDALAIQEAGAFAVVLEAIPGRVGKLISEQLDIPTIGIGAGVGCDGQVLVQLDMMGVNSLGKGPRFLKTYADLEGTATSAIRSYVDDVRSGNFPEEKHSYPIDDKEWEDFKQVVSDVERDSENAQELRPLP